MSPVLISLLVIGPFAALIAWWFVERSIDLRSKIAGKPDNRGFAGLDRASMAVGWALVLGYCLAIGSGWLRPRSISEGVILLAGTLGWILFSTRRSVRDSAEEKDARQIREIRFILVMLTVFGAMLGVAIWLSGTRPLP